MDRHFKNNLLCAASLALATLMPAKTGACTNFIVGKNASVDGSVICTYNADDYGMFIGLCHYPTAKHEKGEMRQVVDWDTHEYRGQIPEVPETYNVIGNINEYQVTIGETTYGGREEMVDTNGLIDYGSLIYIGLQRSRTAREAIQVMTSLAEEYGYASEGETFSVCDANEAWILEMMGKGSEARGVVWVAMRIPDNAICAHANQSRIGKFNMRDKNNVMYSKDVITFARGKGWFSGKDVDFSWKDTYAKPNFEGRRMCDARVWSFFNHFADGFDRYLPWALGVDSTAEDMPLWVIPSHKISAQEIKDCMRDHYEGTPLAIDSTDIGGGIWQMPYRPTPLVFTVNGKRYFNERPISTQQTGFTFVAQMRSWLPRQIGGLLWFGNDDPNMIAYTPVYCGNTIPPECYDTPNADALTFSDKNAYWVCNWVSNMVYPRYSQIFPDLKEVRDSLERVYVGSQASVEEKAKSMYTTNVASALAYLNDYSNMQAQQMLITWKDLAYHVIVKYNDMTIKPEANGHFLRTKSGIGATVIRPGYPETYAKKLVKDTGDKYAYPEE